MQTHYFFNSLEELLAQNKFELSISLLRKFTKYHFEADYKRIIDLSHIHQRFRSLANSHEIAQHEVLLYQEKVKNEILAVLASVRKKYALSLSEEIVQLANQLLQALPVASSSPSPSAIEAVIPAARPVRLSIGALVGYTLILLFLGAIAPLVHLMSQQWLAEEEMVFGQGISQEEISDLATYYQLTEVEAPNHHLSFNQSDLAYWRGRMEEGMDRQRLEKAFSAIQQVLLDAQEEQREILTHDDLYMLARSLLDKNMFSQRTVYRR